MDERQMQVDRGGSSRRPYTEFSAAGSRGWETAAGREYEMLVAEGHYRCSHCRRADLDEMPSGSHRMR
jgi:hypothetical protein